MTRPAERTPSRPRRSRPWWRSLWWMPAFSISLGVIVFTAFALGENAGGGAVTAAVFVVLAAIFARDAHRLQPAGRAQARHPHAPARDRRPRGHRDLRRRLPSHRRCGG